MGSRKFRLQSVLDYREQLLDLRQQEMAVADRAMQTQKAVLTVLQQRMRDAEQIIRTSQGKGTIDCEQIVYQLAYLEQLKEREKLEKQRLAELTAKREAKRQELMRAMQDKQGLDKLKERHQAQLRQLELHQENKMLDEISVIRFHKKVQTEGTE